MYSCGPKVFWFPIKASAVDLECASMNIVKDYMDPKYRIGGYTHLGMPGKETSGPHEYPVLDGAQKFSTALIRLAHADLLCKIKWCEGFIEYNR